MVLEELNILAVYFIISLVVERVMEFFSEVGFLGADKAKIKGIESEIDDLQTRIDELLKDKTEQFLQCDKRPVYEIYCSTIVCPDFDSEKIDCLRCYRFSKQKVLMQLKRKRSLLLLFGSILLGLFICYCFNIGLFRFLGIDIGIWDVLISGLIVGGGTKPTHDLISFIEKIAKKDAIKG